MYNRQPLLRRNETTTDLGRIQALAPSVFADRPAHDRSDRYAFIPTSTIVEKLFAEGFAVSRVQEQRARKEEKIGFTRHMLRFRHPGLMPDVGDIIPEIVLTNSHDGTSAFQMSAGFYRLVCANGLMAGSDQFNLSRRHSGSADDVIDGVFKVVEGIPGMMESVDDWRGIELSQPEQINFARAAIPLRFDADDQGNAPVQPEQLLGYRRYDDRKSDLFHVMNRVQENIMKGGVSARTSTGTRRRTTAVNSVREDVRLNKSLWMLAESMAELKRAA